jgi:hypothetical protein
MVPKNLRVRIVIADLNLSYRSRGLRAGRGGL